MAVIDLVINETMYNCGIMRYIPWDTEKSPHMAISGITGTGKTYLVKLIIARISKYIKDSHITVCDFKGGDADFSFLSGCERFYRFDNCITGFNTYYDSFLQCQRDSNSKAFHLLIFDEWASYLNYLDKKEADDARKKLASLLMLSRSFNYHILLSQQRLDAESFGKSRDNINVIITLGNPSKEVREMLFSDFKEHIKPDRTRGKGYMINNGTDFQKIIVPQINDMNIVNQYIKQAVER